jgi:hypothetical protein
MAIRGNQILRRKRSALVRGEIKGGIQMHVHLCATKMMEKGKLRSCLTRGVKKEESSLLNFWYKILH